MLEANRPEAPINLLPTPEQSQAMVRIKVVFDGIEKTHFTLMQTGAEIASKFTGIPLIGEAALFFKGIVDAGTTFRAGYYVDSDGNRINVPDSDRLGVGTRLYLKAFEHGARGQVDALTKSPSLGRFDKAVSVLSQTFHDSRGKQILQAMKDTSTVVDSIRGIPLVDGWIRRVLGSNEKK